MGATLGVTVVTLVGGLDHNTQAVALAKRPHVIVGSPGRVVDHLQQTKGFSLKSVKVREDKEGPQQKEKESALRFYSRTSFFML